jgi:putative ABC transport system permease protein
MTALRTSTRGSTAQGRVLRRSLVVAELALAVTLLIGAGLLGKSFLKLAHVDLGFRTDSIVSATVFFPAARYTTPSLASATIDRLVTQLRSQSSVKGVAAVDVTPLTKGGDQDADAVPIGEALPNGRPFDIWYRTVTPSFMQLMSMRLVGGRGFAATDRDGGVLVGIVNESAARLMWPGKNPLGRQVDMDGKQLTVVGVVANSLYHGPNQPIRSEMYVSLSQFPTRFVTVMVDPKNNVAAAVSTLRETLHSIDPAVPLGSVRTMSDLAGSTLALPKVYALIVVVFATAALGLAVLGVYGVMAFVVAQRQREIGVRLALGATPNSIQRLILGEGSRLATLGIAIGLVGAAVIGRALSKLLFQTGALDGLTYVGVAGLLGVMSLAACWLPARRAMSVDPLVAMRNE